MEPISISAIVISIISALSVLIASIKLKYCRSGCCESECLDNQTPRNNASFIPHRVEPSPRGFEQALASEPENKEI